MSTEEKREKIINALSEETASLGYASLNDDDVKFLVESLNGNNNTVELLLANNEIKDDGLIALAEFISGNQTVNRLSLNGNKFGVQGLSALGEALKVNTTLLNIGLDEVVSIADDVVPADCPHNPLNNLFEGLRENKTVQSLVLSSSYLNDFSVPVLTYILRNNPSLQSVRLQFNFFTEEGLNTLRTAAAENSNLTLEL